MHPWAQYSATQERPLPPATAARSVAGPTESKFKEQEGKIGSPVSIYEGYTSSFQTETKKNFSPLDTNIRQQGHDLQNRLHSIGLRFDEHQKDVALQLQSSAQATSLKLVKGEDYNFMSIKQFLNYLNVFETRNQLRCDEGSVWARGLLARWRHDLNVQMSV